MTFVDERNKKLSDVQVTQNCLINGERYVKVQSDGNVLNVMRVSDGQLGLCDENQIVTDIANTAIHAV